MKKKSKLKKFFISIAIILVVVIVVPLFIFTFETKAEWFSEEQHAKRISRRIDRKIKSGYFDATGYELYPVYSLDEELRSFLVEFEPIGHMYVLILDGTFFYSGFSCTYYEPSDGIVYKWNPCTIEETGNTKSVIFDRDENGRMITCRQSPFKYRDKLNERKYMISVSNGPLVPAIKNGDKFINLYANYEFEISNGKYLEEDADLFEEVDTIGFMFIRKRYFIL